MRDAPKMARHNGSKGPAARILATAAAKTWYEAAPEGVRQRTVDVLLDTVAVMALGSEREELRRLRERLATGPGGATVIGSPMPAPASLAALLNAATTSVHQIDEGHRGSRGHAGNQIVPAALAVAEEHGKSGVSLLSAILAGYEVAVRVGAAMGGLQPMLHPHGCWGTMGAAASVAHLLTDGDEGAIATAIDGAAAITLFPYRATAIDGASIHHFCAGLGAQIGVQAGCAAASGFTAISGTLESFFGPRAGAAFDPALLVAGIDPATGGWSDHEILRNYFKIHPSCAHTHSVVDAAAALVAGGPIDPEAVERIDVRAYRGAYALSDPRPSTDLAGRFSVPFTLALLLATGEMGLDSYSEAQLSDPGILELAARVHLHPDPDLDRETPTFEPVAIAVRLKDGTVLESKARIARGDWMNPITREELHAKALRLMARRFGDEPAQRILQALLSLGQGEPLARVSVALRQAARSV